MVERNPLNIQQNFPVIADETLPIEGILRLGVCTRHESVGTRMSAYMSTRHVKSPPAPFSFLS
jgi:hypothetical protein